MGVDHCVKMFRELMTDGNDGGVTYTVSKKPTVAMTRGDRPEDSFILEISWSVVLLRNDSAENPN